MINYKYNSTSNYQSKKNSSKVFRQSTNRSVLKNKGTKNTKFQSTNNKINFLNLIFVSASIFSIISLGLIFTPSIFTSKTVNAESAKPKAILLVTNYSAQEAKPQNKGKSFLKQVTVETPATDNNNNANKK